MYKRASCTRSNRGQLYTGLGTTLGCFSLRMPQLPGEQHKDNQGKSSEWVIQKVGETQAPYQEAKISPTSKPVLILLRNRWVTNLGITTEQWTGEEHYIFLCVYCFPFLVCYCSFAFSFILFQVCTYTLLYSMHLISLSFLSLSPHLPFLISYLHVSLVPKLSEPCS